MRMFIVTGLLAASTLVRAQDVALLAGQMSVSGRGQHSFGANLSYAHRLGEHLSMRASYLNEGHPQLHHRDGFASQLWLHSKVPAHGWSFAAGAGPYLAFDTTFGTVTNYRNQHAWGGAYSLSVKYHMARDWYLEAQVHKIRVPLQHDSSMLLFGLGYELQDVPFDSTVSNSEPRDNFLMLAGGQAIVNSFKSERSSASAVEYRRSLSPHAEWSLMWLNQGRVNGGERKGVATQISLVQMLTARFALEVGGGMYAMRDHLHRGNAPEAKTIRYVPMSSIGLRYRLTPYLRAQLSWNRVITGYHRDSDVLLAGLGGTF